MGLWHCPHCGTAQAEAARCWVCKRSSTTCRTCRHFRPAVVGGLGYCATDRQRTLRGDEVRGCWEASEARASVAAPPVRSPAPGAARTWTEVGDGTGEPAPPPDVPPAPPAVASAAPAEAPPARPGAIDPPPVGLWGEIEP